MKRRSRPSPPYCQSGPRWVVERLQDKQALAPLAGIPHVLDWSHEAEIWRVIAALDGEREGG